MKGKNKSKNGNDDFDDYVEEPIKWFENVLHYITPKFRHELTCFFSRLQKFLQHFLEQLNKKLLN